MKATPPCGNMTIPHGLLDFLEQAGERPTHLGECQLLPTGLACFNQALHRLSPRTPAMTMDQIANAAARTLAHHGDGDTPSFVQSRMAALERLELLAVDPAWGAEARVRRQVAILRQYREQAGDLIPDRTPVIGLLDDAVLVEVALQLLRAELALYEDFCRFRRAAADFADTAEDATGLTRGHWLAAMIQPPAGHGAADAPAAACVPDLRAILFHVT